MTGQQAHPAPRPGGTVTDTATDLSDDEILARDLPELGLLAEAGR